MNVSSQPLGKRVTGRFLAIGFFLGLVIAGVCTAAVLIFVFREDLPAVTEETLNAAESRWNENGPVSYDIDVEVGGARPGRFHVEVRRGRVVSPPTLDGHPIRAVHAWSTWTIEGQFETIHEELRLAADPQREMNAPPGTRLVLRGTFHPLLGYPLQYRRLVLGEGPEVSWKVIQFQAVEPQGPSAGDSQASGSG